MNILNYDRLLNVIPVWGTLTAVWPLDSKAGRLKVFVYNIFWCICVVNVTNQSYLLIKSIFPFDRKDFINTMKTIVELIFSAETLFNVFYCKIRRQQLQKLLFDIEQCVQTWTPYEKIMREKFMRNICAVYLFLAMIYIIASWLFILLPIITDNRDLPLNVVYPFLISKRWIYYVAYTMNVFSIAQSSTTIVVDIIITATLWQAAFKFHLLGMQMRSVVSIDKLRTCIITYQNILNYVREIDSTVSYIFFKLTIVTSVYIISSGLLILNNAPIMEMNIFLMITIISIWRLIICCWSAQAITDMSYNVSWQIYDSPWINTSPNIRQTILMIVQRCQKPIAISGSNFIPIISIRFCGSVLSTTFSYFMALRTILR